MAYGDLKDLNRRTFADKVLCNRAFEIAKDPKHDGYQCGLASKTSGSGIKNENVSNKELVEELHKPITGSILI